MQPPPRDGSHIPAPPRPKPRNPLLSLAESSFTLEDIAPGARLVMPVRPISPAVLRDVPVPAAEPKPFPSQPAASVAPPASQAFPIPEPPAAQPAPAQPSRQGYFTSILSSLPSLSLASITGEDSRPKPSPASAPSPAYGAYPAQQHAYSQVPVAGELNVSSPAPVQQPPPIQPPPFQPPPAFPPSGGAASYRLGNQRRLQYAPPPDLKSTSQPQQHFQPPAPFPPPSSLPAVPPTFFNPASQPSPVSPQPGSQYRSAPAPPSSEPASSQGSSLHGSFRSSPDGPPSYRAAPPPLRAFAQTAPQAIPARLPEPATPQNTPADVAFAGFGAYRQPEQPGGFFAQQQQLEAIQEASVPAGPDKTFSPISAAQVSERLENLISAAEQSDDAISVKSELSAEVAKITAGIPESGQAQPPTDPDDLTEIDLGGTAEPPTPSEQPDDPEPPGYLEPAAHFFGESLPPREQSVPTFYSPAQQQQPLADPFAFLSSGSSAAEPRAPAAPAQSFGLEVAEPKAEPARDYAGSVNLTPSVFWDSGSQAQASQPAVLNPLYGRPAPLPPAAPSFFNPAQFGQLPVAFPGPPAASSAANVPAASGSPEHSGSQLPSAPDGWFEPPPIAEPKESATLSPVQMSVGPLTGRSPQETVPPSLQNLAAGLPEKQMQYRTAYHHWFHRREVESKTLWIPFSMHDSLNLEEVHNSNEISPETKVATDGGRYDVEILRRQRSPVYWTGPTTEVRRCSWFYKGPAESRYTPYEESVAARLEEEFKQACESNNWNRRVDLANGEHIVFHSPGVQVHYLQATTPELAASWGNNSGSEDNAYLQGATSRPRIVKRGMDEFNIDEGEPERIDHLLFLIHGIGSVCDLKFRSVEEVVDEFRSIALQLVQSHYRSASEQGIVNRIEVLPVSWHATLHSGIDKKLQVITLESIPKWRHFTNDTLLDILFYTSPVYCETIMQTVGNELNRLYALFNQRNPDFCGNVYLGGHSLGSLIVFDLLCHQKPVEEERLPAVNGRGEDGEEDGPSLKALHPVLKRKLSKKVSYVMGAAGTGQPFINYPQLAFSPRAFFALGSPIGMFVTVRGIDNLGEDFVLPTCPAFFNIFHPFDPVAYRVESLVNPEAHKYRPMLIPHHKGRKRMHLELKETMARVGADLKQKLMESVRNTWNSVYQLAIFHKQDNQTLEEEIEKVVEEQLNNPCSKTIQSAGVDESGADLQIGRLNGGRRIDYVLQEAPFEYINEYIFAMTSHVCYWESEDTMLLILKEIYGSMGIQTDAQLPQQSLSIERVSTPVSGSSSNVASPSHPGHGLDPTAPMSSRTVGPPPVTGFVRKS